MAHDEKRFDRTAENERLTRHLSFALDEGTSWAVKAGEFARKASDAERQRDEALEALRPFARLEIPKKPQGNAGAYSIRHDHIRAAVAATEGREPASVAAFSTGWAEKARELYERCKCWPEKTPDGFMALLELRNHVFSVLENSKAGLADADPSHSPSRLLSLRQAGAEARSPQFTQGMRSAQKRAVAWLHERAASMNDPHAAAILNSAAFSYGQHVKAAALVPSASREGDEP